MSEAESMKLPRVRFTVRAMMVAVAVVGFVLMIERVLFEAAVEAVNCHTEPVILGEAVTVWAIYNVFLAAIALVPVIQMFARIRSTDK